jgi:recombination DNA repair RAD52 pathway protein
MSYRVFLAENNKYVICRVSGPMNADTAVEFSREMDILSRAHGIKRFLTDVRDAPNTSSVSENHSFAQIDMKKLELQKDARSAILTRQNDRSHDFVAFVSQNAGYNVRLFDDEAAAITWLEE